MNRLALLAAPLAFAAGCNLFTAPDDEHAVGSAIAAIGAVPSNVGCIQVTVSNGARQVQNQFTVTPGAPATLHILSLPVGLDTFVAAAWAGSCPPAVTASTSWASAPTAAPITAGGTTNVSLHLVPSGGANVGIDFDADGGF